MKKAMYFFVLVVALSCEFFPEELEPDVNDRLDDSTQTDTVKSDTIKIDTVDNDSTSSDTVKVPLPVARRLGLHYTEEEVEIWRKRSVSGPYKSQGDAGANTPGDWKRILSNANNFLANPSEDQWTNYFVGGGCLPKGNHSIEPRGKIDDIKDAAFVYLITGEEKYSKAVRDELLFYARNKDLDFSDRGRFCLGAESIDDVGPGFWIAAGVNRMLYAYDYIKETVTAEERKEIDEFLMNAGRYFQRVLDDKLSTIYSNRSTGLVAQSRISFWAEKRRTTHDGGYDVPRIGLYYNNRRGDLARLVGTLGVFYQDQSFIQSAKFFFKEWLKYAVYPDGTMAEMERGVAGKKHELGWQYSAITASQMIEVADAMARQGDQELYHFVTSEGIAQTKGGQKDLLLVLKALCKYLDKSWDKPRMLGSDYIDGFRDQDNRQYIFDLWFSQANVFYNDGYIQSVYLRQASNTDAYNGRPLGHGAAKPWGGPHFAQPGKLLMYGQMEGVVWPYAETK